MNFPYQDFKVKHFPVFEEEECERKAARPPGKVLLWCLHLIWTHTSDSFCRPWEFTTWRQWFTRLNPPSCLIPWGDGAEVGAKLGYQSVFLPSVPSLFSFSSSSAYVGHFVIYSCHKARRRLRTVWDYMKRCLLAYFMKKIKQSKVISFSESNNF